MEVSVHGSLLSKAIKRRALVANTSCVTQISQDLANKLGLTEFNDVFVRGLYFNEGDIKWKISLLPIVVTYDTVHFICYPLVNCTRNDAFYDLILGADCCFEYDSFLLQRLNYDLKPSPGPNYQEGVDYLGHALRWMKYDEFPANYAKFLEFRCSNSEALQRLAINRSTRQLVVIYRDSSKVYRYSSVSKRLENQLVECYYRNGSLGTVVAAVREACIYSEIDDFPRTVLLMTTD